MPTISSADSSWGESCPGLPRPRASPRQKERVGRCFLPEISTLHFGIFMLNKIWIEFMGGVRIIGGILLILPFTNVLRGMASP